MSTPKRASLSQELQSIRPLLRPLIPRLEAEPEWYASVYVERKSGRNYTGDFKRTHLAESRQFGAVLRIYDGYTLFEQATDRLDREGLESAADALVSRVRRSARERDPSAKLRVYRAPDWADRLSAPLDEELLAQIPKGVSASTPVHFGVRYERDPFALDDAASFARIRALLDRTRELSKDYGFSEGGVTYARVRYALVLEESLFADRAVDLSQALYRISTSLVIMSGSERTYERAGGLGGLEAADIEESTLRHMLEDLRALKSAEKLKPGKYRVLLAPSLSGVFAHEAFGHSQEGDTCARGRSKAWDLYRSQEAVGNEHATILNNPAIYRNGPHPYAAWGSYFFDEEGWLAREQVLLDGGRLGPPMTNLTSAVRLGVPRTANGKRESWMSGVYTRQTNTYFSAGDLTLDELLARIDYGFVATHAAGGMEDPKGMGIQVGIAYLKEVRDGKLTGRLFKGPAGGDVQITGYTPDLLFSILGKSKIEADREGADSARHPLNDVGGCGKYHKEFVNAGCGGPYLLLDNVTLG